MTIAIHQPNFIPWYPFFQKVKEADIFIILTHCQFEKNNYQNRFNANNQWYTMRVKKGMDNIINKTYVNPIYDWNKIKKGFPKLNKITSNFDECITDNLAITNINIIKKACELLNITTKIKFDSPTDLNGTARLVDLCKNHKGTEYISGIGGKNYLQPELFKKEGIKITYQTNLIKKPLFEILNYE
jgi:hypothetical protein